MPWYYHAKFGGNWKTNKGEAEGPCLKRVKVSSNASSANSKDPVTRMRFDLRTQHYCYVFTSSAPVHTEKMKTIRSMKMQIFKYAISTQSTVPMDRFENTDDGR